MNFPALLIALFIDRVFPDVTTWRQFAWLRGYFGWFGRQVWVTRLGNSIWPGITATLPLLLIVFWVQFTLAPSLGALFLFLFDLGILLLCLGPGNLDSDADGFLQAASTGDPPLKQVFAETSIPDPANGDPEVDRISQGLLIAFCRSHMGPICWFALLGPLGAVAYRLSERMQEASFSDAAIQSSGKRLFELMNWIPARLSAAGFAIAGDFDAVAKAWKHARPDPGTGSGSDGLLIATGQAALPGLSDSGSMQRIENTLTLAWRTLTLFVAILGIAALLSWI